MKRLDGGVVQVSGGVSGIGAGPVAAAACAVIENCSMIGVTRPRLRR
ncbi:hypothetical protein [Nocardia jiangxiensis]|nr:hypothetical protein [Nocardia jiangxiensis]